jgi:hypothetical protein
MVAAHPSGVVLYYRGSDDHPLIVTTVQQGIRWNDDDIQNYNFSPYSANPTTVRWNLVRSTCPLIVFMGKRLRFVQDK